MLDDKQSFDLLLTTSFKLFLEKVFETLHPGELLEPNWHLDVFEWYVKEIIECRITRLVVNLPPRSLKSLNFNIALSAFLLGLNPKARIMGISCTKDLSRKHSNDTRKVMESEWYRRAFPKTKLAKNTEDYFETTVGGFRRAASPEVGVTGKGATHIICDDLVDAKDASNVPVQLARFEWLMSSVLSRFDNPNKGVLLYIGQRLHVEDPSGALIKMPGFKLLKIAAIAQDDERYPAIGGYWEVSRGKILQELLANDNTLSSLRAAMGVAAFAAQYLQEPIPEGGGLFAFSSFARRASQPCEVVYLSVDTGQTKGGGDYSVIMAIGYENERFHILDVYRDQVDFDGLCIALLHKIEVHQPAGVLIETTGGYGGASWTFCATLTAFRTCIPSNHHCPRNNGSTRLGP